MKKFSFKLEKLLMIKLHNEQIAKEKYAAELQKKVKLELENTKMSEEIYASSLDEYSEISEGAIYDFNRLQLQERYITGLKLKIEDNERLKLKIEPVLQKLKEELTAAMRERKMLEKLKEKELEKYRDEYNKFQTKVLDDIAGQRLLNRRRSL
jgi:flagellar protein FliJ